MLTKPTLGTRKGRAGPTGLPMLPFLLLLTAAACRASAVQPPRFAFVASAADGTITAIDLSAPSPVWTLSVSTGTSERAAQASHGIAAQPDSSSVYAGDAARNELVIVDARQRKVIRRVALSHGVHGIDISPDGKVVWVGGSLPGNPSLGAVSALDSLTGEVLGVVSPGVGGASHLAVSPDGNEVWVASATTNVLWIVETKGMTLAGVVPLAGIGTEAAATPEGQRGLVGLNEVAFSPDGRTAFAVGPEAAVVYAVDVASRRVRRTAEVGDRAHGIAVSRDGREVWVANRSGGVTVLESSSLSVVARIPLGDYANHVAFDPEGRFAYVSRRGDVAVLKVLTRELYKLIGVGREPHEISLEDWEPGARSLASPAPASAPQSTPTGEIRSPEAAVALTEADLARTVTEAGVTVTAVFLNPLEPDDPSGRLRFRIALDTHAGDLRAYDIAAAAAVRNDAGAESRSEFTWEPLSESTHHRAGLLAVRDGDDLAPGFDRSRGYLELELRGIASAVRVFRWELGRR